MKTTFDVRWLLTHRNKTIKRECCYPFFLFFLEQFQLHFRVTKADFTKTGLCVLLLHLQQEKYLVGAYVIHLGQQLMQQKINVIVVKIDNEDKIVVIQNNPSNSNKYENGIRAFSGNILALILFILMCNTMKLLHLQNAIILNI